MAGIRNPPAETRASVRLPTVGKAAETFPTSSASSAGAWATMPTSALRRLHLADAKVAAGVETASEATCQTVGVALASANRGARATRGSAGPVSP